MRVCYERICFPLSKSCRSGEVGCGLTSRSLGFINAGQTDSKNRCAFYKAPQFQQGLAFCLAAARITDDQRVPPQPPH